ncbi:aquaporin AQPAe.a-like [Drosophila nasuta]|uniref:aquaporin AQPAe.a-like n=1 Tax=Drosophila nasuta TaxID=42062 RepID=UPI00295F16D5|nr:aquaporin AQPAe.a-like [Drosophila nasuta]
MTKFNKELLINLIAEFLASMLVQFAGCGVTNYWSGSWSKGWSMAYLPYAVGWGGSVIAATQAFRILSGAHINPCISIAAMIMQQVEVLDGFLYILMQLLGSAAGFGVAYGIVRRDNASGFCVTRISIDPWWKSILLEFYMTGAWVLAMCASWNVANEELLETISLRIGIVVAASTLAGGGYTGASMNPFRSLWPAIADSFWDYIYIYMVVPPITAALLAVAWRFLYLQGDIESSTTKKGGDE